MFVCMTKSNKFEHLKITGIFLSFDKIGKFGTLKDTIIGFKLEAKKNMLKRLTVRTGLVEVLGSCSHGHSTVPLCIISHQNKQIMESFEFKFIKWWFVNKYQQRKRILSDSAKIKLYDGIFNLTAVAN